MHQLGLENYSSNRDDHIRKELLLTTLLKMSFYPSLKGDAKEAASIGHKMKEPICKKLFQEVPSLQAASRVGLIEKVSEPWIKDSADFLTFSEDDSLNF